MIRKGRLGVAVALIAVGMLAVFATTASATPSKTSQCSNCHDGAGATITTTLLSASGTSATYSFSAPGADYVSVFNGTTRVTTVAGASGQFTVTTGNVYTIFAVTGPGTSDGLGTAILNATAPVPVDATAPVTTSDAKATYVSSAAIKLSATDAGSGVANTYYKLNGGAQMTGTSINVATVGSHTIEFWSVDVAGNAETHKTASFTITAPVPVDPSGLTSTTVTLRASYERDGDDDDHKSRRSVSLSGKLSANEDDLKVAIYVMKPGSSTWVLVKKVETKDSEKSNSASWKYRYNASSKGTYKFQARFAGTAELAPSVSQIVSVRVR